jgi:hypothetical protein
LAVQQKRVIPPNMRSDKGFFVEMAALRTSRRGSEYVTQVATIEFYRPRTKWRDRFRSYNLLVDSDQVGKIRSGQTLPIEVSPGRHTAQARISWTGSEPLEFDLAAGSQIRLRVEPAGDSFQVLSQAIGRNPYLRMSIE